MINKFLQKLKSVPIIYVKPSDIQNQHSLDKNNFDLNGDWDKLGRVIQKGFIFKSFKERLNGAQWEQTTLFKRKKHLGKRWLRKLSIWDSMLEDITINGYTQRSNDNKIDEYISILIGRHGHLFIYNGIHRLCCCLLSDKVDKIPVKVLLRHTQWAHFKRQCEDYARRRNGLYAQLPHPDLSSIPFNWTNERAELIAENSNYPGGTVIDIGSHWGTTSYILAQHGFKVTAIEKSRNHFNKLKKLSMLPGKSFKQIKGDFTFYNFNIDTCVMLNIVHHFIIDKAKFASLIEFLDNLNTKELFYQAHGEYSKWAPHLHPEEFLSIIMKTMEFNQVRMLKDFNGRKLYHITR